MESKRRQLLKVLRAALVLFALLPLAARADSPPADVRVEPFPIKVGIDLWPGYFPVLIARELGFFAQRGLKVEVVVPENTATMMDRFAAGDLDVICVALGDVFTLKQRVPGLRVPMITDESAGGDALLSLHPLPASLKGLKIGTNLNGFGELLVREFLAARHVRLDDVTLVQMDAASAGAALRDGRVDIAHTWEPYVSEVAAYQDARVIFSSRDTPGLIPDATVFNPRLLAQPRQAKAFIAAWQEAVDWWQANRHEGDKIAERALYLMPNTTRLEGLKLYDRQANRLAFRPGRDRRSLFQVTREYLAYFREKQRIDPALKPEDILEPGLLPR